MALLGPANLQPPLLGPALLWCPDTAGPALLSAAAVEGQDQLPCYHDPGPAVLLDVGTKGQG